ncbi:hypothetical protein FHETE_3258 [Fusarium heterosporum]|uniref:Uncharacterized protein n=1 Tax=Fusarium heterosporum TaxID=42747 RepID=A0A8H5TMK2_FUSHE|nr:hypothetical protein FHETE_3258 [Fusarium heterosporum]
MQDDGHQTRQIAANLAHGPNDDATLYTRVQHEPAQVYAGPQGKNTTVELLEVTDRGWDSHHNLPEDYAIDGMKNEDIWLLVRRFNKRVFHVKHDPAHSPNKLDFNVNEDEDFSPNKLRAQLERLYMEVVMGMIHAKQHIARLQSWREPRRTTYFCVAYFAAWYLNLLMPTLLAALFAMLLSPEVRRTLFPPHPTSLVHYKDGSLIKPPAGILSTDDTGTGAPENLKGQALEREASNFVTGIIALAANTFVDEDPQHSQVQKGDEASDEPESRSLAMRIITAKDKAGGVQKPSWDKTKKPMQEIMWTRMKPLMHKLCVLCDTYERLAKLATFGLGVVFFGSDLLVNIYSWLKPKIERLFKGIPTDVQVTVTLLREGERIKSPLIPPPQPHGPPPHHIRDLNDNVLATSSDDPPLGATPRELQRAIGKDEGKVQGSGGNDHEIAESGSGGKRRGTILKIVKPIVHSVAKTVIAADKLRGKTGTESAKRRIGACESREQPSIAGPVEFVCRWEGHKGYVYLTTDTAAPCLCFTKKSSVDLDSPEYHEVRPSWIILVADITALNKYTGYGTKAKLAAGWALEVEIMDGIEIIDREEKPTLITAMARRDELFNRLCAIGNQKWEIW